MNDTVLVANHTQIWLQKQAGITLKLAASYRNNEVVKSLSFILKRSESGPL